MNAVGIDVSKGKSMVAILRPYGEIVSKPFEVRHTARLLHHYNSLSNKMDNSLLAVRGINHKYIVVERGPLNPGIDVSKGKSMVAIMRPFGEVVSIPFEIKHTTIARSL